MKTFQRYFSILVVLLISIVSINQMTLNQASAQCPPEPDCFADLFAPGPPIVINDGGCIVTINWCWRIACGVWNDFVITSITRTGSGCPGPSTDAQLQEEALKKVIDSLNPWGTIVPPCPQQSSVTWRLGKLACVAEYRSDEFGFTIKWPCEPQSRCWERYTSCYQINPISGKREIILTYLGSSFPAIPCSQTSAPAVLPFPFPLVMIKDCHSICP